LRYFINTFAKPKKRFLCRLGWGLRGVRVAQNPKKCVGFRYPQPKKCVGFRYAQPNLQKMAKVLFMISSLT